MRNLLIFIATLALFSACKSTKDDEPLPAQEVLTTLKISFNNNGTTRTFTWSDPDGAGGKQPTIDTIKLDTAVSYVTTLAVLDASKTPINDRTPEIISEGAAHQFFFSGTAITDAFLTWLYADQDNNGYPIGITTSVQVLKKAGKSTLKVVLRHEPTKSATGVAAGNITNAGGDTDIEVVFPVVVK